jgi:methionine synthase II (cobalamin-independent)
MQDEGRVEDEYAAARESEALGIGQLHGKAKMKPALGRERLQSMRQLGGFEPLHVLQDSGDKAKKVVLGLVTTKVGALESKDELKRRIDEASKALPLERLCLSPQCGFSSTHHGNALSPDEQWHKLERVIEVAHDVWG